jgi:hypothetical protein
MGRLKAWGIAALLLAWSTSGEAASLSGTYVGTGPDIAILLQLVDAGGGQLTGRYEHVKLLAAPKIERVNAVVKGNVDGETIVLEIKPTEVLSNGSIASGTVAPNALHLTGGGNGSTFTLNLSKASEEAFNSQVAALTNRESEINITRTIATDSKQTE